MGLFTYPFPCDAQNAQPLPGCEPSLAVRKTLRTELDPKVLDHMPSAERFAREREVLTRLIAQYPRELVPQRKLHDLLRQYAPQDYQALQNRWMSMAKDHPHDPLALVLGAEALWGKDTPQTIRLLESARDKAPSFPWPARDLAGVYSEGKRADPSKAENNLDTFFSMCPTSNDGYARFLLTRAPSPLQKKIELATAQALRTQLKNETDPDRLLDYGRLWALEFRTRPPQQYDALRLQITADLKRLEKLNPEGSAEWQALLITGTKQSGASLSTVRAMQDQLIRNYPHSTEAFDIVSVRWDKSHKAPSDPADGPAWAKYDAESEEQVKRWMLQYTDDTYVQRSLWFDTVLDDYWVSEKDGIAAVDLFVRSLKEFKQGFLGNGPSYAAAAEFLIEHNWQPQRALDLLQQAKAADEKDRARLQNGDNDSGKNVGQAEQWRSRQELRLDALTLKAAMEAKQPHEALKLRAFVEAPPPSDKELQSQYWWNRARFASIQDRPQNALAYYQLALRTRTDRPTARYGQLRDDLSDEAHALWKAQGGSDAAWAAWSNPRVQGAQQIAEGAWEKPIEPMPAFQITDLSGKTWRLKDLQGKSVLIDVWATWCGPCQEQLPYLQKFFEKVKNRSDIQVLTFDIDEDPGLVPPYLKQNGYTFPVLPVYSAGLLDDYAVPQTWVVDSQGIWRWKETGFRGGTYADFEKDILAKLQYAPPH